MFQDMLKGRVFARGLPDENPDMPMEFIKGALAGKIEERSHLGRPASPLASLPLIKVLFIGQI
jgi:hypothetical protein